MFNQSDGEKNAKRIAQANMSSVKKEQSKQKAEEVKQKTQEEKKKKKQSSTEKRRLQQEEYNSEKLKIERSKRENKARDKYAEKVKKRKAQRLEEEKGNFEDKAEQLTNKDGSKRGNLLNDIGKQTGLVLDGKNPKDTEPKKAIPKRMLSKLSYKNNQKWLENKINHGEADKGFNKIVNSIVKKVTKNDDAKLNMYELIQLFPQVKYGFMIATIIFTILMWFVMFIPLAIAIFGVVVILLNQEELGIDLGVDINGVSSSSSSSSSKEESAKFGNASKVTSPKNVNWVFPLSTPNETVEYNGGFEPRDGYNGYSFHYGIDMGCNWLMNIERNVYAVEDGVVDWVHHGCPNAFGSQYRRDQCSTKYPGGYGTYGNLVRIHHEKDNLWTLYAHLEPGSNSKLKVGSKVKQGQVIGLCGDSGGSWGHHLHFEVWKDGTLGNAQRTIIDPHPYIGLQWARERRVPALNRYNIHGK